MGQEPSATSCAARETTVASAPLVKCARRHTAATHDRGSLQLAAIQSGARIGGSEANVMAMHLIPFTLGVIAPVTLVSWLVLLH